MFKALILLLALSVSRAHPTCPFPSCTHIKIEDQCDITCESGENLPDRGDFDQNLTISHLRLYKVVNLTDDAFSDLSINTLELRNVKVIQANVFRGVKQLENLEITSSQFTSFDYKSLSHLENLTTQLELSNMNSQTVLNNLNEVKTLANLQNLILSSNSFTSFHSRDLRGLEKLQLLRIESQTIQENKLTISNHSNLLFLHLPNNELTQLEPEMLDELPKLNLLDLGFNKLKIKGDTFEKFNETLRTLNLEKCFLGQKTDYLDLSYLTNLANLDLESNALHELKSLQLPITLSFLNLRENKLEEFAYDGSSSLRHLILSNNQLTNVELNNCTALRILDLNGNNITHLSNITLADSSQAIVSLNLSENFIQSIEARDWEHFKNLAYLFLSHNELSSIGSLSALSRLSNLDLSNNRLTSETLTKDLAQLGSVSIINLRNNQISDNLEIPAGLKSLTELNLKNNQIDSVQASSNLTTLRKLTLSENKIKSLDNKFTSRLRRLERLELRKNSISQVPDLTYLSKLNYLDLHDQNGQLTSIQNFAFTRQLSSSELAVLKLTIDLTGNADLQLGNQAFCSSYLYTLAARELNILVSDLDKLVQNNNRKCILKQLVADKVIVHSNSSVNCSLVAFAKNISVQVTSTGQQSCSVVSF